MTVERYIRILAGTMVLVSLALGATASPLYVSDWFLALTAFSGFNLLQAGITNFCLPAIVLKKLGVPEAACKS